MNGIKIRNNSGNLNIGQFFTPSVWLEYCPTVMNHLRMIIRAKTGFDGYFL